MLTFIIVTLILIVPIPIKFRLNYIDKNLNIYLYNINIIKKYNYLKVNTANKNKIMDKKVKLITIKNMLSSLNKIKFKPTLRFKINFEYGLDDAAFTAIVYGLIYSSYPFLIKALNYFFKIKKQSVFIKPNFNKFILKFEVHSIIFVNLAKIIYMLFIIYKSLKANNKIIFNKN